MLFGLKKSQDLLTNPRLNTNIHQDFISNLIQLIFPEKKIDFKNKSISNMNNKDKQDDQKKLDKIKSEILSIIDSKDEAEEKEKDNNAKSKDAFYLRNTMLMSSSLSVNKKIVKSNPSTGEELNKKNNSKNNHEEFIKSLENTFDVAEKIVEGMPHPKKKDVYAKKVYKILPYFEYDDNKFSQIIFPDELTNDNNIEQNQNNINEINELNNQKYILRKNLDDENTNSNYQIYTFYKYENEKEEQIDRVKQEVPHYDFLKKKVNFFNYEREYSANIVDKSEELFNRYLIFMDKAENTAKILPIFNKVFLKKYKKLENSYMSNQDNTGNQDNNEDEKYSNFINRKTRRDIKDLVVVPKNIDLEELKIRNQTFNSNGFLKQYSNKNEKIETFELERKVKHRNRNNSINNQENSHNEDDENDLFGEELEINEGYSSNNQEDLEFDNSNKNFEEEDFKSGSSLS